jgi:SH3-like domain-containing protein
MTRRAGSATRRACSRVLALVLALLGAGPVAAAEFRSIAADGVVLYDAPSARSKKVFVATRHYPVEVVVNIDGWMKVRDIAGDLFWVEKKALSEQRTVLVRGKAGDAPVEVRERAEDQAPVAFRAQPGIALDLAEAGPAGWVRVRHRDGSTGFMRVAAVWGL